LCQILIEFPPAAAADIPTTAATSNTTTHTFKAQQQLQDSHDLSESLSPSCTPPHPALMINSPTRAAAAASRQYCSLKQN